MRSGDSARSRARAAALAAICGALALAGCGFPAAPEPPSLRLPQPVTDLHAARTGDVVALAWTMPKLDTSKVALQGEVLTRICRQESAVAGCTTIENLHLTPGAKGSFQDALPAPLVSGAPSPLRYFVELINDRGRSAGLSNSATVPAGQAPAPIAGVVAQVRKDGVALYWPKGPAEPYPTQVRLQRTLLTSAAKNQKQGPLAAPPEPSQVNLLVPAGDARDATLDKDIRFGETYEYRAQRFAQVTIDGKTMELDGPWSPPVKVAALNTFPPAVPRGLAAVANPAQSGTGPSIDLSWQPDGASDVAGYAVYRRAAGQPESAWTRISGPQPVVGPAFHDGNVQAGQTYEYAVTAIGQNGVESRKSESAEETVPGPN